MLICNILFALSSLVRFKVHDIIRDGNFKHYHTTISSAHEVAKVLRSVKHAREAAVAGLAKHAAKDKKRYDRGRRTVEFKIGDQVLIHDPSRKVGICTKLRHRYKGPYRILERLSPVNYRIDRPRAGERGEVVNVERLAPYYQRE